MQNELLIYPDITENEAVDVALWLLVVVNLMNSKKNPPRGYLKRLRSITSFINLK